MDSAYTDGLGVNEPRRPIRPSIEMVWKRQLLTWGALLASILASGTMFVLSMPLSGHGALGFVFLMPLLLAVRGKGGLVGFIAGLGASLFAGYLSTTPLAGESVIAGGTVAWNFVGFGLFGLVIATMTAIVAEVKVWTWKQVLLLACAGVALELVTFIKLPAQLALTQFRSAPMLALASVTGIWGVSWLVWAANLSILASSSVRRRVGVAVAVCGVGFLLQVRPGQGSLAAQQPRVYGLVQSQASGAEALFKVQAPLVASRPDLVVWPELSTSWRDRAALAEFSSRNWPVVTSMHDDFRPKPHNAAYVFDRGQASAGYFKRNPFGEEAKEIIAGEKPVVVRTVSESVGLNICFDSCFPWTMRETAQLGADVIALPTLDPQSPNGFIQTAHAAFTPFRAAELGLPIIRAEQTAWSMVVDARGAILGLVPIGEERAMARAVASGKHMTVYRRFGDWFLAVCLMVCLGSVGGSLMRRRLG